MTEPRVEHVEGSPLSYLVRLPKASERREKRWPVLCFLHGYDEGAPLEIRRALARHGPLSPGASEWSHRFVVVAPQLPVRGDLWSRYGRSVSEIVGGVCSHYGGDPTRVYLTGFSFGGNGVFDLALQRHAIWAALWPVDPTRVPDSDPGRPLWLSSGEVSRRRADAYVERLELEPAEAAPFGDRIYEDRGSGHVGTAQSSYAADRVYSWLLSHWLPG